MQLPVNKFLYSVLRVFGLPVIWEVSVGSVLFRLKPEGGREYLVLQYPSGHYDFPKGHIEAEETEEETLRRETKEETGIQELEMFDKRFSIKFLCNV